MATITVTKEEAIRRGAPQMAGMRVKILGDVPGPPDIVTYRVEWPYAKGFTDISRKVGFVIAELEERVAELEAKLEKLGNAAETTGAAFDNLAEASRKAKDTDNETA
jgi:hypothetical protein